MSIFPMPRRPQRSQPPACPPPLPSLGERLRDAERRCAAAQERLERVVLQADTEAEIATSAIARLSADLNKERARANEFKHIMTAMRREFAILTATATELARHCGASPAMIEELRRTCVRDSADPDHAAVGLHQSAPDFLVKAARTAYRKAYHPDTKSAGEKAATEVAFKRNEAAFRRVFRKRGLTA